LCPQIKSVFGARLFYLSACQRKSISFLFYQHVNAVGADYAYEEGPEEADQPAGVLEGVRHRQDARSEAALKKMQKGLGVAEIKKNQNNYFSTKLLRNKIKN